MIWMLPPGLGISVGTVEKGQKHQTAKRAFASY